MSQIFILSSIAKPENLPASPALHLLPFSLGPNNSIYESTNAPISEYFQPRPCPPDIPNISPGTPIATFRGRQVVGQTISVPRGYRGIVLGASKFPQLIGTSSGSGSTSAPREPDTPKSKRNGRGSTRAANRWPLTPASSESTVTSNPSINGIIADHQEEDSGQEVEVGGGVRRSPRKSSILARVRGAGQIALSRPKTRQVPSKVEKKRKYRLDSEDVESEEEGASEEADKDSEERTSQVFKTPSKRVNIRSIKSQPDEHNDEGDDILQTPQSKRDSTSSISLPEIKLQEPTPIKAPLPKPIRSLPRGKRSEDYVIPGTEPPEDVELPVSPSSSSSKRKPKLERSESSVIIPSPKTEDDPPIFDIPDKIGDEHIEDVDMKGEIQDRYQEGKRDEDHNGPIRKLKAIATFNSFMLWTPDAPLAGFKVDEMESGDQAQPSVDEQEDKAKQDKEPGESKETNGDGVTLRKGWWRTGGAGEGGDEMVRAMGEWLGMVEMLNKAVYLEGLDEDEDEEDDL